MFYRELGEGIQRVVFGIKVVAKCRRNDWSAMIDYVFEVKASYRRLLPEKEISKEERVLCNTERMLS